MFSSVFRKKLTVLLYYIILVCVEVYKFQNERLLLYCLCASTLSAFWMQNNLINNQGGVLTVTEGVNKNEVNSTPGETEIIAKI